MKIVGDWNCLLPSFPQFVHDDQEKLNEERIKIVQNIVQNWTRYKDFVANNNVDVDVSNANAYSEYMLSDSVFGGELEIQSFFEIYSPVTVTVHVNGTLNTYGHNDCSNKLILNFSGPLDIIYYY